MDEIKSVSPKISSAEPLNPPGSPLFNKLNRRPLNKDQDQPSRHSSPTRQQHNKENICKEATNPNISEDESETENSGIQQQSFRNRKQKVKPSTPPSKLDFEQQKPERILSSSPPFFNKKHAILVVWIIIALLSSVAIFLKLYSTDNNPLPIHDQEDSRIITRLREEIQTVKHKYPLQSMDTWINFMAAINSVLDDDPPQPAVLLLVGSKTAEAVQTIRCLAKELATLTNKLFNSATTPDIIIQVEDIVRNWRNEETVKGDLHSRLHSVLVHSYSVVFGHLENIPPKAAMVLHGFCDNFGAPFKKRVIMLTVTFEPDSGLVNSSKQVDSRLRQLWDPELGADKSAPIISRVANSPVFILPERDLTSCAILK